MENQNTLPCKKEPCGDVSIKTWRPGDLKIIKDLLNLFVLHKLHFKYVENKAFIKYKNAYNRRFIFSI